MSDRKGDPHKQPTDCMMRQDGKCPHVRGTLDTMEGENYECDRCGERYKLYYEDMA